jgi:hypothetical protein
MGTDGTDGHEWRATGLPLADESYAEMMVVEQLLRHSSHRRGLEIVPAPFPADIGIFLL